MSNATVPDQLQHMWRTRPYRLPQRGHVAGVAAGIGYRYGVDPVLVRVALVVGTIFGGAGIVLYLAAWLLFSKAGDSASPAESLMGKGHSSESTTKVVVLIIALAIAISTIGPVGVGMGGSGPISMLALLAGLWLLYQRRPEPPEFLPGGAQVYAQQGFPISFNSPYTPGAGAPNSWAGAGYNPPNYNSPSYDARSAEYPQPAYTPYTTLPKSYVPVTPEPAVTPGPEAVSSGEVNLSKSPTDGSTPEQATASPWDPLGVAPLAWDLPELPAKHVPDSTPKRKHSKWTSTFIGLALVAAAIGGAIAAATDSEWLTPARIGAIALAVVAVGLILGAFMRKGYGLLIVTGPLLAFVILASILGPISFDGQFTGEQQYAPTSSAELAPDYTVQAGDLQLDLRGLELTEDATVSVSVTAGNATIMIPESMNIRTDCSAIAAETNCGPNGVLQQGNSSENTAVLTINGLVRAGNLEVIRG